MPANTPYPNETDAQFRARQQQQGQHAPTHRGVVDSPGAKRRRGRRPRKQMTYTPTVAPTAVGPAANMAAHTALTQERDAAKMQGEQTAALQAQLKDLETQLAESQQGYQDLQGRYQGVMEHEVALGG